MTGLGFTYNGQFRRLPGWMTWLLRRFLQIPLSRLLRGTTFGVQALAFDDRGRVLLIRQSYSAKWQFPGGGVDRGESLLTAVERELREEANAENAGTPPRLFGVYTNFRAIPGDHIALFIFDRVTCEAFPEPNREIIAHGFFDLDALPDDTSRPTLRRIAEIRDGLPPAETW
ncbi:MAG: NUDIX domain-containing protein [Rhodobiaceae bacterium]|nr:NUDIX domain-containing protein [Rhodobiaceae bacterium]